MPYRAEMADRVPYDEFSYFHENAAEFGIPYDGPPTVRRERVEVEPGRGLSALVWGDGPPEIVLLHGGAQNAHTWDTVAMALDRPARRHRPARPRPLRRRPRRRARTQANAERRRRRDRGRSRPTRPRSSACRSAGSPRSRWPSTARARARAWSSSTSRPGVDEQKAQAIIDFIDGPESFPSFDEILARTIEFNPTRTESSLRRGILHNAQQLEDGSWVWRYARFRMGTDAGDTRPMHDFASLWDAVSDLTVPLMLVRGMREQSVVDDADEAELLRRRPTPGSSTWPTPATACRATPPSSWRT